MNLVSNWRFRAWTLQTSSPGHPGDKSQRLHPLKVARNNTNFCFSLKVSSLVLLRYSLWTGPFVLNLWEATAWVYFLRTHLLTHSSNTPKCKQNKNKPGKFIRATLEWTVDNLFFNFRLVKVCLFLLSRVLLLGHGGEGSPWSFFFSFLICRSLISHNGYGFYSLFSVIPLSFSTAVFVYFLFHEEYF